MDEHWKPASYYCSACMIEYDYIIKFEDYLDEGAAFMNFSNLTRLVPENLLERHINPNRPDQMTRYLDLRLCIEQTAITRLSSSSEVTKLYFGMLTDTEIRNLYQIYLDDFKMFGYTFNFRNVSLS